MLRPSPLPVLGTVPPFALVERSGAPVTAARLAGHVWIANFIFTRCPDVCPALTAQMSRLRGRLQTRLRPGGDPVRLVSFTVDPAHDTPEVLRAYADRAGAGTDWLFVGGPRADIAALLRDGFRVAYADDGPPAAPITHSDRFVLVDRELRIRGYSHGLAGEDDLRRLARDAIALRDGPMASLPALNAVLNTASATLLVAGYLAIRRRRVHAHRACMVAAFLTSILFLASYVTYHLHAGTTRFAGTGWVRPVYFVILTTHTLLAVLIPPLATTALVLALRASFARHARLARWTFPAWLYVSVTGVVVYVLLYHL